MRKLVLALLTVAVLTAACEISPTEGGGVEVDPDTGAEVEVGPGDGEGD